MFWQEVQGRNEADFHSICCWWASSDPLIHVWTSPTLLPVMAVITQPFCLCPDSTVSSFCWDASWLYADDLPCFLLSHRSTERQWRASGNMSFKDKLLHFRGKLCALCMKMCIRVMISFSNMKHYCRLNSPKVNKVVTICLNLARNVKNSMTNVS